jgi:hypothetical protein
MGGAATAARRLAGTSRRADALYSSLSPARSEDPNSSQAVLDRALLAGKSADEVIRAVIESVSPIDGTLDAEASRDAIRRALSELLVRYPEADLLALTDEQRDLAVELYISRDVFNRFELDLGKTLNQKAPSAASALARTREVLDYIRQTVAAAFRKVHSAGRQMTGTGIATIIQAAIEETFNVFEEYVT